MREQFNPLVCARPTAHPRIMKTVDSYFEGMELLFEEVPVGVVYSTVQSYSKECSSIDELTNEKLNVRDIVFLAKSMQKCSRWIGAVLTNNATSRINCV
jgi:hypothetical protein